MGESSVVHFGHGFSPVDQEENWRKDSSVKKCYEALRVRFSDYPLYPLEDNPKKKISFFVFSSVICFVTFKHLRSFFISDHIPCILQCLVPHTLCPANTFD